jgi:CRP/FNR family transcriptional regulator, anaerobic regulatory protein
MQAMTVITPSRALCSSWDAADACLPCGLARVEGSLEGPALSRRRVRRGEVLFRQGDTADGVFVVRAGSFKGSVLAADGIQQVVSFSLPGEVVGLQGWASGRHGDTVVALEDSELTVLSRTAEWAHIAFPLERALQRLLGREVQRAQWHLMLATRGSANQRIAGFLLDLSQRMVARGYSGTEFLLRMTRADLGDYLCLQLETVSRSLRSLQDQRLLEVEGRRLRIRDLEGLRQAFPALALH